MMVIPTVRNWMQKIQQDSSIWGSLLLWLCGVGILVSMMVLFAHSY
jgi:hypothetical protein